MKKILIIAGGEWQVPIIKKAKCMGLYVAVVNLYENSIGFKYADEYYVCDVKDKENILKYAKKLKPDAVITDQTDISVPTVAYICDQLGLSGIGMKAAELFTNKYKMRNFCNENDFEAPIFQLCNRIKDTYDFINKYGLPIVIKPADSQSSRGVNKINNILQVENAYYEAKEFSSQGDVIVEQFIEGIELTAEGFILKGKHHTLAISQKKHYKNNPMVASELLYSSSNENIDYISLEEQHNKMIEKTNLKFGITHVEYIYSNGKFYLVEMAARGGGTRISSHIVPIMSGVDINEILIRVALGENKIEINSCKKDICCILKFLNFSSGIVSSITGLEKIKKIKNVVELNLNFDIGDKIENVKDDRSRHGFVLICEENRKKAYSLIDKVEKEIVIKYE